MRHLYHFKDGMNLSDWEQAERFIEPHIPEYVMTKVPLLENRVEHPMTVAFFAQKEEIKVVGASCNKLQPGMWRASAVRFRRILIANMESMALDMGFDLRDCSSPLGPTMCVC